MKLITTPFAASPPAVRARAAVALARSQLRVRTSVERREETRHRTAYYRRLWTAAAAHVGAPVRELADGTLEIGLGTGPVRVRGPYCSIESRETLRRAGDKTLVHRLLAEAGLPAPEHRVFTLADLGPALRFLAAAPAACVVKPALDGAAGFGVTTQVRTPGDLVRAAAVAAEVGVRCAPGPRPGGRLRRHTALYGALGTVPLLIERQVPGENYRLLYLDGELVDAIRRGVPSVVGDGRTTVRELLRRANAERLRAGGSAGQLLVSSDLDSERTLADQGLTAASVPAAGVLVRLQTKINQTAAETNHPARRELCASILQQGARAAEIVGARWAGVDVITPDPTVPLGRCGGRILEVNTTPGLAMHEHGRPGAVDPATVLLRRLAAPRAGEAVA